MNITGILQRAVNGGATMCYMSTPDGTDRLLIRHLPPGATLPQRIAAATAYFQNVPDGAPITINGTFTQVGAMPAIEF